MVLKDFKVYSCGSHVFGALGHGEQTRRCVELKPIDLPFSAQVIQVSASDHNVAFLMQSGEVGYFLTSFENHTKGSCGNYLRRFSHSGRIFTSVVVT